MLAIVTVFECLLLSAFGSANQILLLTLDPEMGRVIGKIGEQGYKSCARRDFANAFRHGAIEVRNDRQDHVSRIFLPIFLQHLHGLAVMHADYALNERKQLRGEAGPAFSQDQVVSILNANASGLAHDVEFVQQLLQIEQFDSPWLLLIFQDTLQGFGGAPVATSGIEKDDG